MARLRPPPRRPSPPPLQTDDVGVAAAGTVAWSVALLVLLVVDLPADARWWRWVCVTGIAIGLFAVWYTPRLQRNRAAAAKRRAQARHAAETETAAEAPAESEQNRGQPEPRADGMSA